MLPLSGPGYRTITAKSEPHRLSVVDLDWDGIRPEVTDGNPFLLIDTWIVDRDGGFGGAGHGNPTSAGVTRISWCCGIWPSSGLRRARCGI